jgi:hypothetical protein
VCVCVCVCVYYFDVCVCESESARVWVRTLFYFLLSCVRCSPSFSDLCSLSRFVACLTTTSPALSCKPSDEHEVFWKKAPSIRRPTITQLTQAHSNDFQLPCCGHQAVDDIEDSDEELYDVACPEAEEDYAALDADLNKAVQKQEVCVIRFAFSWSSVLVRA